MQERNYMLETCYSVEKPQSIIMEEHNGINWVWLNNNVEEETIEQDGEELKQFKFDCAYFETSATKKEIEKKYDEYFEVASKWERSKELTNEERISALEDVVIALLG